MGLQSMSPPSGISQRAAPRHELNPGVTCEVFAPATGQSYPTWVRDISAVGISFLLETQLSDGDTLEIVLRGPTKERRLRATVRHGEIFFPNNTWLHGCAISPILQADELREFMAPASRA